VPEGIDVARVTAWMVANVPGVVPPLRFELVSGGRSNLTYRVEDASGGAYALRRPPTSHVLPTAHDMAREHRILSALGPTAVPVPRVYGLCEDPSVSGAPFYVMEFVDGLVLRDRAATAAALDVSARRRASESLVAVLASLHLLDVDEIGLGDLARRDGYVARQIRRWREQFERSAVDDGVDRSIVLEVGRRLEHEIPAQQRTAVVHGDYRLDNVVLAPEGTVRAVLDWEICTLGDPLADLGLLLVYWAEPGEPAALLGVAQTALEGFWTRRQVVDHYAATTGFDVSDLDYFVAFGYWKLACILQGVYARYLGGAKAGDRSGVEGFATHVVALAERAAEALGLEVG
jgi:aminoglycoside phosphotransferase (APT) family kinase protein